MRRLRSFVLYEEVSVIPDSTGAALKLTEIAPVQTRVNVGSGFVETSAAAMCFHWWPSAPSVRYSNDLSYQIMFARSMSCSCNLSKQFVLPLCKYLNPGSRTASLCTFLKRHTSLSETQNAATNTAEATLSIKSAGFDQHCMCLNTWSTYCNFSCQPCVLVINYVNLTG